VLQLPCWVGSVAGLGDGELLASKVGVLNGNLGGDEALGVDGVLDGKAMGSVGVLDLKKSRN